MGKYKFISLTSELWSLKSSCNRYNKTTKCCLESHKDRIAIFTTALYYNSGKFKSTGMNKLNILWKSYGAAPP